MEFPNLIESNVKTHLFNTLHKCHEHRTHIYLFAFNVVVFVVFIVITGSVLYYSYNKRLSPYEQKQKLLKEQDYVLSKIRFYQDEKKKIESITRLPTFT